jgi:hypothetical protein
MIRGCKLSGTVWDSHHHHGRLSLLRLRGENQFNTPMERNLFRVNYGLVVSHEIASPLLCMNYRS